MATIQKFYLHAATTSDTGTLPAAGTSVGSPGPTVIATGGDTNRSADGTIGVFQTSNTLATNAVSTAQTGLILRFCSAPIAAQTIASNSTWRFRCAYSESNTNSNWTFIGIEIVVWRPGTGAVVGRWDNEGVGGYSVTAATVETDSGIKGGTASTSVTAQDGDILVFELWRASTSQGMSTSYNNIIYYDGTVEGSATDNAAYVDMGVAITMSAGGGGAADPTYPYGGSGGYYGTFKKFVQGWSKRRSGLLIPEGLAVPA